MNEKVVGFQSFLKKNFSSRRICFINQLQIKLFFNVFYNSFTIKNMYNITYDQKYKRMIE